MALCPGLPGWAGTRKLKPIWILLKQETVSGSGISWAIMKVCNSLHTDNHTSTPPLSFLQAGCPSWRPTNSVKALKARTLRIRLKILSGYAQVLLPSTKTAPSWGAIWAPIYYMVPWAPTSLHTKQHLDQFNRLQFTLVTDRDRLTDWPTDGQTEGQTTCDTQQAAAELDG